MSNLFPGTHEHRVDLDGVEIFARAGGSGPPLLLIHGFPQTHAMWHWLAPALMQRFTCVMPDLRGYGYSSCPQNDAGNRAYSKRAMAQDMVALMASLGHNRFAVAGHDRGGRVAYRLALDHPRTLSGLAVLDIVPTYEMWHNFSVALAMKTYHWLFLAQPNPLPSAPVQPAPVQPAPAQPSPAASAVAANPGTVAQWGLRVGVLLVLKGIKTLENHLEECF